MLFIELTDQCNERCIHCYASSSPDCHDFLSLDQIKQVLDHARKLGKPFIQFTGGDPFIHKSLLQSVEYASQLDFQGIEIYTNGLLLSNTWLEKLKPYNPRLCFSIYSDLPECHDLITQLPGSWKKTLHAMRRAIQAGFEIRAGVAIMPENINSLKSMQPFLKEQLGLDPQHVRFDPVKQTGRGQFMQGVKQILVAPSHAEKNSGPRRGKLCVSANGNVYPCIFSRSNSLGNIQHQSLTDIMTHLQQQKIVSGSFEYWNSCRESLSCGDCQIMAYALGDKKLS
ncbi:MAG: radical SAM protein [Mariprofundaceae bacterium]